MVFKNIVRFLVNFLMFCCTKLK